jgi:hypothetical protein
MTRTLGTALVALTLGFAPPAIAQDSQLAIEAQNLLDEYGYEVDATLLDTEQLAEFQTFQTQDVENPAEARQRIDRILVMDAGTATFVSDGMQAMFEESTALEDNARQLLDRAGFDEVDVSGLTNAQLARMWFLQERDGADGRAGLENRIQAILDET